MNRFKFLFCCIVLMLSVMPGYSASKTSCVSLKNQSFQNEKQDQYRKHLAKGDSLLALKDYEYAMVEYQRASRLMPYEDEPRLKIQACETAMGLQKIEDTKKSQEQKLQQKGVVNKDHKVSATISNKITQEGDKDSIGVSILDKYQKTLDKIEEDGSMGEKATLYSTMADEFKNASINSKALEYYQNSLTILEKEGKKEAASDVLENMAEVYLDSGLYVNTVKSLEKSAELKKETGNIKGMSNTLNSLGKVLETTYDLDKAIDTYEKSAEIKTKLNDKQGLSQVRSRIGDVYYKKQILDKSIDSYEKAAVLNEELNNQDEAGSTYNKIGVAYAESGNIDLARNYYEKSYELKKSTGNDKEASMALNNLGNLNYSESKYKKAINYYEQSLQLKETTNYIFGKALTFFNLGKAYQQVNDKNNAIRYFEECRKIALEYNFEKLLARSLKALAMLYNMNDQVDKAKTYSAELNKTTYPDIDINDPVNESQLVGEVDENQQLLISLAEEVRKQRELALREAEQRAKENLISNQRLRLQTEQIKRQKIFLMSSIVVIILVVGLLVLFYYQIVQKKKANKILTEKNNLISKQAKLITDNIKSASAIQRAAMPPKNMLEILLPEYFVLNMPKDIVSGDFYWMEKRDDKIFVAVADCTGHGVQGAVVSMLGMALLNEIVNKSFIDHPGEILNQLSSKIKAALHAGGDDESIREGMDIVLLKFDRQMKEIEFAGANNPVIIIRNNEAIELKGDRSPIGYYSKEVVFSNQVIKLEKGDSVYMFSDGYADQLSGETYKKYLSKRFRQFLIDIEKEPMDKRQEMLVENFHNWRGKYQQVDDVMIMCIKL